MNHFLYIRLDKKNQLTLLKKLTESILIDKLDKINKSDILKTAKKMKQR